MGNEEEEKEINRLVERIKNLPTEDSKTVLKAFLAHQLTQLTGSKQLDVVWKLRKTR